jgi:AcrR family transcriptional regulator
MLKRKDGAQTAQRIFDAACGVFGDRGYHAATHAEICAQAGANIAAINYHFGSKDQLYRAVCEYALNEMATRFPIERAQQGAPEARLRVFVETLLARSEDGARWGFYHGLRMHEFRAPSGVADDLWAPWFKKHQKVLIEILEALLGPGVTPEKLHHCQMSIVGPCSLINSMRVNGAARAPVHPVDDTQALVDHLVTFALAGLGAQREHPDTTKEKASE